MAIAIEDLPVAPPTRITFAVPATDPVLLVHEEVLPNALEALVAVPQVHLPGVPLKLGSLTAPVAPILWEIPCFNDVSMEVSGSENPPSKYGGFSSHFYV